MFTEAASAARNLPVGAAKVDGHAVDADIAHVGVFHRGPEPPRAGVGVVVDAFLGELDSRRGEPERLQPGREREVVLPRRPPDDTLVQRVFVGKPAGKRGELRVAGPAADVAASLLMHTLPDNGSSSTVDADGGSGTTGGAHDDAESEPQQSRRRTSVPT